MGSILNEKAEEFLIGCILKDNSVIDEITLMPEHFLDLKNRNIYKSILNIKKKSLPIDAATLKAEMGETGFLFIGGNEGITNLKNAVSSAETFNSYEKLIVDQWKVYMSKIFIQQATEKDLKVEDVQALINKLTEIDGRNTNSSFNLKNSLIELYEMVTVETPKGFSGISSGFVDIDKKTDGWQNKNLIIIGARPSMGKTAFALNLSINSFKKSNAIPIIFSLEMGAIELEKRMISNLAEINGMKLKNPYHYTTDEEKERWIKAIGTLEDIHPEIVEKPRITIPEMRAHIRQVKRNNPGRKIIVFIDYLTLIGSNRDFKGNMHSQITEISADLKTMAKDFDCPVVCLAQLSRSVESRNDKRPMMSDLRESGSIEQDADVIALLYRDEYYNETTPENKDLLEVDIQKNRDGEVGLVKLLYKKDINKIENLYHYHNLMK